MRLRDAVEASASAPTYFPAHGRFIDGGTTVYNNPAYVAAVEALRYSSDKNRKPPEPSCYDNVPIEVYSFSTGFAARAMEPGEAMKKSGLGWIDYVIGESSNHAGYQQSYISRSELGLAERAIAFYRYDLYLNRDSIEWAVPGSTIDPEKLTLDAIDDETFELMNELGRKYGAYLFPPHFTTPAPPPACVAAAQMAIACHDDKTSTWPGKWDQYKKPERPADYLSEILAELDEVDQQLD